ncbi:MAG TPA: glycosyltransferase family 2 protein [Candidatus Binataceae bacterium]
MSSAARLPGLSVFLPSHNEEGNVERVVRGFLAELPRVADDYEVIVVDDGSTDRTLEKARALAASDSHVKVVHHERNRGYGGAVISGIRAATMPYVLLADGDGQFDPRDTAKLVARLSTWSPCDVVVGRRVRRADPLMRRVNGRAWTILIKALLGISIDDIDCGFKLFRRELLDGMELKAHGAMISTELMARLAGRGAKVDQVDILHLPRMAGEQSGASAKVVLRAFRELFALFRELRQQRVQAARDRRK